MKISKPLIYLITKGDLTSENFPKQSLQTIQLIALAIEAGVSIIQIREKNLSARLLLELATKAVQIRQDPATKILVNDRADVALAAKSNGVHLTSTSISTKIIRQSFPKDFIIGVSTHTLGEVTKAQKDGADFVVFSPIFATISKEKYGAPQGVEKLAKVVETVKDFPVIALGGINEGNFAKALNVGAAGIAGISMFSSLGKLSNIIKKINNFVEKVDV